MQRKRPAAAAAPPIALAVPACGSSGHSAPTSLATPTTSSGQAAKVGGASASMGQIRVDSRDRTLYLFQKDAGTSGTCTGACATVWPPLRATGPPTAGPAPTRPSSTPSAPTESLK
jgi:predicted lipoprotein with Yx(FWY)xxD motif